MSDDATTMIPTSGEETTKPTVRITDLMTDKILAVPDLTDRFAAIIAAREADRAAARARYSAYTRWAAVQLLGMRRKGGMTYAQIVKALKAKGITLSETRVAELVALAEAQTTGAKRSNQK